MKQIVFTKKEIEDESSVSRNSISKNIDKLVELGILEIDNTHSKKTYKYKKIYDVFTGRELF